MCRSPRRASDSSGTSIDAGAKPSQHGDVAAGRSERKTAERGQSGAGRTGRRICQRGAGERSPACVDLAEAPRAAARNSTHAPERRQR